MRHWISAVLLIAAGGAMAQAPSSEWDWQLTPYLWSAGIEGDIAIGPIRRDVDVDFSDLLDVLAGAALFRVEGGNDTHGVLGDVVWMQLEPEDGVATVGGVAEAEFDSLFVDLGYVRKLDRIDLEIGIRYWDLELEITPAQIAGIERGDSWADGYVGIRVVRPIGTNWLWQTRFNVGAGSSDSTFNAETHFALRVGDNRLVIGFRAVGVDYGVESVNGLRFEIDTTFLGATIGFMFD